MKKIYLFAVLFLFLFLTGQMFGYEIYFTSPTNGQVFAATASVNVRYYHSGERQGYYYYVKLFTHDGDYSSRNNGIIPQWFYLGNGTYSWRIEYWEGNILGQEYKVAEQSITFYVKYTIQAANNFSAGTIELEGSTVSSGSSALKLIGESVLVGAIDQNDGTGYDRIWNTNGTNNSNWYRNYSQINGATSRNYSYTVASDDNGATLIADLKKICNLTFSNPGHSITLNGNNYTSSASSSTVEQNTVTASAEGYFVTDGIEHMFLGGWRNSANQLISSTIITATQNDTYTAEYLVQALVPSISFGTTIGQPVYITWTDNPNTSVTQYRVHRRVFLNGSWSSDVVIGTVNRGVQSFTDYDYDLGVWKQDILLEYGLTAYYSVNNGWSTGGANTRVYCTIGASMQDNDLAMLRIQSEVPTEYQIGNYPNPFNPATTINYQLPENSFVTIKVYDILGKEVATLVNESKSAGFHNVSFDASRLTSGIYIYTINAGKYTQSKKMLLTK